MNAISKSLSAMILGALVSGTGYGAQSGSQKVCTLDEAEEETDRLKDWDAVYRFFKNFSHCDNGAVAEGLDDSIVKLLQKDWNDFDVLARLARKNPEFEKFVLRHIDELASQEELRGIARNAKTRCPSNDAQLCTRIGAWVATVLSDVNPFLGALEDVPRRYPNEPNSRAVRMLFQKNGNEWQAFRPDCRDPSCVIGAAAQYPTEINWTIAFDGKNLGQITTSGASEHRSSADIGLQQITSRGSVPTVGKRAASYSGFARIEVYRPLVAVSQPNFEDPEVWKATMPSPEAVHALRQEFRKKFPPLPHCDNSDQNAQELGEYSDEDVVIEKAYSSRNKWLVAGMKLIENRCGVPIKDGGPFDIQWYALDPSGSITFLDSGLWLVDAGDYDRDGKSELLFAIDRHDVGGYELFYDEFKKHATFQFVYH